VSNQESQRLQYALRQRASELGWNHVDIDVIDSDLGLSGASAAQHSGFKELVGRVGLSEVGLILSIDVTRLARNCSDWYPLLDLCGLRGCLIADRDGVYEPNTCARRQEESPAMANFCCTASPGAQGAATRCMFDTSAAGSTFATTCARTRGCPPANKFVRRGWTPRSQMRS
jgi:hypothetical protein